MCVQRKRKRKRAAFVDVAVVPRIAAATPTPTHEPDASTVLSSQSNQKRIDQLVRLIARTLTDTTS
jgi:hypothetical protein